MGYPGSLPFPSPPLFPSLPLSFYPLYISSPLLIPLIFNLSPLSSLPYFPLSFPSPLFPPLFASPLSSPLSSSSSEATDPSLLPSGESKCKKHLFLKFQVIFRVKIAQPEVRGPSTPDNKTISQRSGVWYKDARCKSIRGSFMSLCSCVARWALWTNMRVQSPWTRRR